MNRSSWRARPMSVPLTAAEWQRERDNRAAATPNPPETTTVIGLPAEKKQSPASTDLQRGAGRLVEAALAMAVLALATGVALMAWWFIRTVRSQRQADWPVARPVGRPALAEWCDVA